MIPRERKRGVSFRALFLAALGWSSIAGCSSSSDDSLAVTSSTSAPMPEPSASSEPPPFNDREEQVATALGALGIEALRAENSPPDIASMYALVNGSELFVYARPGEFGSFTTTNERRLAAVAVRSVEYAPGDVRDRFSCGEVVIEVHGAVPSRFATRDEFLSQFIGALAC